MPDVRSHEILVCDNCEKPCEAKAYDGGIGPLDVAGRLIRHSQTDYHSSCCEAELTVQPE